MTSAQKKIVVVAVALLTLAGLFPPWLELSTPSQQPCPLITHAAEYSCIFAPPSQSANPAWHTGYRIDVERLTVEWAVLLAVAGAGFLLTADPQSKP